MKLFYFLLLISIGNTSYSQEKNRFFLNYSLNTNNSSDVLDQFYDFINNQSNHNNNDLWVKSTHFKYPEADILDIINNAKNHKITILSINHIDDKRRLVKIALIKSNDDFGNLYAIYNFMVYKNENKLQFENVLEYNTKDFKMINLDEIKYFVYPNYHFNKKNAKKMVTFNNQIALFFEKETIKFTYFLCKDMNHFKKIRGFDFDDMMVGRNQIGGETFPADNLIFSGNNSEYYPHEIVHLYTHRYFSKTHKIIDEGIATYFGGSKGIEFKEHIKKLKNHLKENDLNLFEKLFNNSEQYILDDTTSLWYTMGALLCDLTIKKYGKEKLLILMNSGKNDADLLQTIEEIFKIKRENFDSFIKNELQNYD